MTTSTVAIRAEYDDEAGVWYVEHSDLPGVHAEGETLDELCGKLPNVVRDIIVETSGSGGRYTEDTLIDIIAHTSKRVAT